MARPKSEKKSAPAVKRSELRGEQAMMQLRRASVIAAPSLLAWTAPAHAECAWVLWYRVTEYRPAEPSKARSAQRRHMPPWPTVRLG